LLDYSPPPLKELCEEVTVKKGRRAIKLKIHMWEGSSKSGDHSPQEEEKTIVVLPGLDDSVFFYEKAFNLIREFNPEWSLLGIDLRGQGKTRDDEGLIPNSCITLDEQAHLLEAILENRQKKKIFLVGLSYGGGIALHYTGHYSQRVLGLGLIAPYVTDFKSYKPGIAGLYYFLGSINPLTKRLSPYTLPYYFQLARLKSQLNPNVNWTPNRMHALTKLTLGILDLNTDKTLDETPHLPLGIHLLSACQDTVVPIAAHRHFYNRIPKSMEKSFYLEDGIGHRVLSDHPKRAARWLHRIL
jgi:pimeloyl-ACP methyl ester carboxylesterase